VIELHASLITSCITSDREVRQPGIGDATVPWDDSPDAREQGTPETKCSEVIKSSVQMFSAASVLLIQAAAILLIEERRWTKERMARG
jgi:hypothetical protein